MDKNFLLEYTAISGGARHDFHAWFATEQEMDDFISKLPADAEVTLALEIRDCRVIRI